MYTIKEFLFGQPTPLEVEVSFSLPYRDWCKFQNSEEWRCAVSLLEEVQKEQGKKPLEGQAIE